MNETTERSRREAHQYLDKVAERLRARSLAVQTRIVVEPYPATAIQQEAMVGAIDCIAVATHGRHGLSRLVLGSVADKIVRGATLPVLIYRPAAE